MLALDDPAVDDCLKPEVFSIFDKIFIIFYSTECVIKIIGMGLIFNRVIFYY